MHQVCGFSLFEVLITLVIISVISGVCFPLFSAHLLNERRLEARIALEKLAAALEEYHTLHNTYQGTTLENLGFSKEIARKHYQLAMADLTENTFFLTATPLTTQAQKDTLCGTLSVNSAGEKSMTGNGQLSDCWE